MDQIVKAATRDRETSEEGAILTQLVVQPYPGLLPARSTARAEAMTASGIKTSCGC
jgi:hypothetical protein